MAEFDPWAAYYDYLHQGLPGEAEFYVAQAMTRNCPVLELGCGTGRIALPVAMSGIKVTGIDNSAAMLEVCHDKAVQLGIGKTALKLVVADMRDFRLRARFPLAFMAYRTFMHCLTPEDQLACLRCIHDHLAPGGELFCNLWAAQPATIAQIALKPDSEGGVHVATIPVPEENLLLAHYVTVWRDDLTQTLHERHRVQEQEVSGQVVHEEELTMTRAWVTPREMEHLVARTGFEVVAVLGDFDGTPLGPGHVEMIWHLRRPDRKRRAKTVG